MRITKSTKEKIVSKAITASGLYARREKNESRLSKWLEFARLDAIGGADVEAEIKRIVAEFRASVESLPMRAKKLVETTSLYSTHSHVRLNVCGQRHEIWYEDETGCCEYRLSPWEITIAADSALGAKWTEIQNEKADIDKVINAMTASIMGILSQATTVSKLLKIWPETEEYLPDPEKKAVQTLPAIPIDLINNQIKALAGGASLATVCVAGGGE